MNSEEAARREEERLLRVMNRTSGARAPTFKPKPAPAKEAAPKTEAPKKVYTYQKRQEEARKKAEEAAKSAKAAPPPSTSLAAASSSKPAVQKRAPSAAETFEERMKRERDEWRKKTQPFRWALEDPENRVDQLQDLIEDPVEESSTKEASSGTKSTPVPNTATATTNTHTPVGSSSTTTTTSSSTTTTTTAPPRSERSESVHDLLEDLDDLVALNDESVQLRKKHLRDAENEATIALTAMQSSTPDKKAIMGFIKKMALASQEATKLITEENASHEPLCTSFIASLKLVLVNAKKFLTGGDGKVLVDSIRAWQKDLAKLQSL